MTLLPKSYVLTVKRHVRFTPESRHVQCTRPCQLWTKSGPGSALEVCRPRRNYDDLIFLGMPETPRYLRTIVTSAQLGEKMIATEVGPSNVKKGGLASDKKSSALLDTPESLTAFPRPHRCAGEDPPDRHIHEPPQRREVLRDRIRRSAGLRQARHSA